MQSDAAELGYKWALGNAISVVADKSHFDDVVELLRNKRNGTARDMMVLSLSDLDPHRAIDVLIELLDDDEIAGRAVAALVKLKVYKARAQIERLMKHSEPWVREEARKALSKLEEAKIR